MKTLKYIGDLFLLAFWSIAYFLKAIIELPYLWIKSKWMVAAVVVILCSGCQWHKAPTGIYFPYNWGEPPQIETKDHVKLPYGYGYGSSTLRNWIELNTQRDRINRSLSDLPSGPGGLIRCEDKCKE